MNKILRIPIECGEKTCEPCANVGVISTIEGNIKICLVFKMKPLSHPIGDLLTLRLPECLKHEEKDVVKDYIQNLNSPAPAGALRTCHTCVSLCSYCMLGKPRHWTKNCKDWEKR